MDLLLDTHALIWWWADSPRLSAKARAAVADPALRVHVSAASAWEIATKQRLGKLTGLPAEATALVDLVTQGGFNWLGIQAAHAVRAGAHSAEHRDPFDRMLAAQAEIEGLQLVSCDAAFEAFGVATLW
jgi:PIN domain nuclease of toxin-antitoxin system